MGSKVQPANKADNLTATCELIWDPQGLTNLWASMDCYRVTFTFTGFYNRVLFYFK
jgi:hypothetical protein